VECRAIFFKKGIDTCDRVEDFGGIHDLGTVGEGGEETQDETEAVEERRWTAEGVGRREGHAVADEAGVVGYGAVKSLAMDPSFDF
jgi:hypothetical protein